MKWRFRLGAVAGNTLEYYDIAVFTAISGYLSAEFTQQGYAQADSIVWGIFALRFLTRPLGGYLIGHYADRVGRKAALILSSFITGVATLCMALLPVSILGYTAPLVVLLLQMTLSLSFGGELATLTTYLYNDAADNERARISSLISGSALIGVLASLLMVYMLERTLDPTSMQTFGWRIPLLFGIVNIAISFWFRIKLPIQPPIDCHRHINWLNVIQMVLTLAPSVTVFYAQNMSMSLIRETLQIGNLKNVYAMLSTLLLLILMLLFGWLIDKHLTAAKGFRWGVFILIIFTAPLYFLLSSNNLELVLLAQFLITANAALIISCIQSVVANIAQGHTATMGVGCNLAPSLFGGVAPLIISILLPYGLVYVGGYIALTGFTVLLSYFIFSRAKALN
ncbi:MFS transporter [Yersinia enterocolitica]|uniref:MFS transporter n=1 Tax=Yersinia enterocolitica TaxID=630 RepID=UPI001C8D2B59|nr:MFS transporter [Yersinia enterocolitica]MBX9477207.1 MFS transporter [Yersinia enterocolitica]